MTFNIAFLVFLYLIEPLIIYSYAKSIFSLKYKPILTILISSGSYMIILVIYIFFSGNDIVNLLSILFINILQLKFLYNSKLKSAVFHGFVLIIIQFLSEAVAAYMLSWVLDLSSDQVVENYLEFGLVASLMIYFTLTKLLSMFTTKENRSRLSGKNFVLFLLPVSSIAIVLVLRYFTAGNKLNAFQNILCLGSMLLLIAANIAMFLVYETSLKNSERIFELEIVNQKNSIDLEYLKLLEKKSDAIQIMSHDFNKHLNTIKLMTKDTEVKNYVESLVGEISSSSEYRKTHNKTLDVIIGKYIDICHDNKISFTVECMSENLQYMTAIDLSSIFNNLLENAVESAKQSEERNIFLQISIVNNAFSKIVLYNSCCNVDMDSLGHFKTTKTNKKRHGLGLKSVIKTVEKYDGSCQFEFEEDKKEFKSIILIPQI